MNFINQTKTAIHFDAKNGKTSVLENGIFMKEMWRNME